MFEAHSSQIPRQYEKKLGNKSVIALHLVESGHTVWENNGKLVTFLVSFVYIWLVGSYTLCMIYRFTQSSWLSWLSFSSVFNCCSIIYKHKITKFILQVYSDQLSDMYCSSKVSCSWIQMCMYVYVCLTMLSNELRRI